MMQYTEFYAVNHSTGAALPYATVHVTDYNTGLSAVLYDINEAPISNPMTATSAGLIGFSTTDGVYNIQITSGSYTAPPISKMTIFDGAAGIATMETILSEAELASDQAEAVLAEIPLTAGYDTLYPNTYATVLPQGVMSGVVGGTAITGATPGTYPLTPTGGSITGVEANLVVTSATAATIEIVNPGLGSGTTPPTWANPSGATLPSGTTLTAVVAPRVPNQSSYLVLSSDSLSLQLYKNNGVATPAIVTGATVPTVAGIRALTSVLSPFITSVTTTGTVRERFKRLQMANVLPTEVIFLRNAGLTATPTAYATFAKDMSGVATILSFGTGTGGTGTYVVSPGTICGSTTLTIGGAVVTGSIGFSGGVSTLTVTAVSSGVIVAGDTIVGSSIFKDVAALGVGGTQVSVAGKTGLQSFPLFPMNSSGIVGSTMIDLGTGAIWSLPSTNLSSAGQFDPDKTIVATTAFISEFDTRLDAALAPALERAAAGFVDTADTRISNVLGTPFMYNVDPGHQYGVGLFEMGAKRVRLRIDDLTLGIPVCYYSNGSGVGDDIVYADLPTSFKTLMGVLDGDGVLQKSGLWCQFENVDWSAISLGVTITDPGYDAGGFKPDRCFTTEDSEAQAFDGEFDEIIDVAVGELRTKLVALWDEGEYTNPNTDPFVRNCRRAHPHHKVALRLAEGLHELTNGYRPNWVWIIGSGGKDATMLTNAADVDSPIVQHHGTGGIWNVSLEPKAGFVNILSEYLIHPDQNNLDSMAPTAHFGGLLGSVNRDRTFYDDRDVWTYGDSGQTSTAHSTAMGLPSGAVYRRVRSGGYNRDPNTTNGKVYAHNSSESTRVADLILEDCFYPDRQATIILATAHAGVAKCRLTARGMEPFQVSVLSGGITLPALASDLQGWEIVGDPGGAVSVAASTNGAMRVAETTPGVAVSGAGGLLLFPDIDDAGRGTALISATGTRALGTVLGNGAVAPVPITIGAQTWPGTDDYTAMSEAAILASINASLTANPITIVDVVREQALTMAGNVMVVNDEGSILKNGDLLVFTGPKAAELAVVGASRVDAVCYGRIPIGGQGTATVRGRIAAILIPEATSNGEFGVGAGGRLDYAATPKVGRVIGGVLEFYR